MDERHLVWHDVTRRKPPALTPKGRAARRRRWMAEYEKLSEKWAAKGDLDMAIYWQERANERAQQD